MCIQNIFPFLSNLTYSLQREQKSKVLFSSLSLVDFKFQIIEETKLENVLFDLFVLTKGSKCTSNSIPRTFVFIRGPVLENPHDLRIAVSGDLEKFDCTECIYSAAMMNISQ